MSKWISFPVIECPKCTEGFQVEDYYLLEPGDNIFCQHCEAEIFVLEINTVIEARIGLEQEEEI